MAQIEWEKVEERGVLLYDHDTKVARTKVPGGWLLRYDAYLGGQNYYVNVTFIPDPQYSWS